jgi:tetratricopeptide (TPR) repeat protein
MPPAAPHTPQFRTQGNYDGAIEDFSSAIALDPTEPDSWKRRGQTRAAAGRDTAALQDFDKALELTRRTNMADPDIYHQRGTVYHKMKNYKKAVPEFERALKMQALVARQAMQQATALHTGNFPNAAAKTAAAKAAATAKSIAQQQQPELSWNLIGLSENSMGMSEKAVAAFQMAIKTKPDFKEAYLNMGQAYRDHGQSKPALEFFGKALEKDPGYAHTHSHTRTSTYALPHTHSHTRAA